jgi:hypothetical protein
LDHLHPCHSASLTPCSCSPSDPWTPCIPSDPWTPCIFSIQHLGPPAPTSILPLRSSCILSILPSGPRVLYIGKYPPSLGKEKSADVIWGKIYEKVKRIGVGNVKEKGRKGKKKKESGRKKRKQEVKG